MAILPDLDRTDFEILRLLQKDARLTNKELASAVDLAPSSTHERVKRLWELGVLRGLHAEVDPHALGIGIEALLMIELSKHKRSNVDAFMQAVGEIPEVRAAFLLTGRWDVVIHVVARDMVISRTSHSTSSPTSRASPESKLRSSTTRNGGTKCPCLRTDGGVPSRP